MTPGELRRLDDAYVRRGLARRDDREVRRLRRELHPRTTTDEQRVASARATWWHFHQVGLLSEVVERVLVEEAAS